MATDSSLPSAKILTKISENWKLLTTTFGDLTCSTQNENILQNNDILSSLENLYNYDLEKSFIDWYFNEIREYLKQEIVEPFRNKSKNILSTHYRQLNEIKHLNQLKNKKIKNIELMNFDTFDIKIYTNFLQEMNEIINEVYDEINKIKLNIDQLSVLLNILYNKQNNHKQLNQRLNLLINVIFLMDGKNNEFEIIFDIMFKYSFIYFCKINQNNNNDDKYYFNLIIFVINYIH